MRLEVLAGIVPALRRYAEDTPGRARFPGAVVLVDRAGETVLHEAIGFAVCYADGSGTLLPSADRVPMTPDTIFDLASVSKLFTSIVVMQQVEAGRLDPDVPARTYLPEFAGDGKSGKGAITARHLLTHTSGLPAWLPLWSDWPDRAERVRAVLTAAATAPPGSAYAYSDLNMITLGELAERVAGSPLDELVAAGITSPLGMVDTGYRPPPDKLDRVAATEYQSAPERGVVRGTVHDENAWSLGGVAGHAGVFGTAADLVALARAILGGGAYGSRILKEATVSAMLRDANATLPGNAHGLGFELDQRWFMGDLAGPRTAGHTGYTGTSLVLDRDSDTVVILLTNRVHPSRDWGSVNPVRRLVADLVAAALGRGEAEPVHGPVTTAPIVVKVPAERDRARVSFDLIADSTHAVTDYADRVLLELSHDGGATWHRVPYVGRDRGDTTRFDARGFGPAAGRQWVQAFAEFAVGSGTPLVRWRTPRDVDGRAAYVSGVRLADATGAVPVNRVA